MCYRYGELSRALRLLHSAGIAEVDEGVLAQLRAKHPARGEQVSAAIEGEFTRHRFDLTEHFRRLRRSAGAGPDGCRNEYRTALTAQFDDPEAAQVMRRFDQFTTLLANVDLPTGGSTSLGRDGERIAQGAPAVDGDGASAPAKAAAARFVLGR